MQGIGLDIPSRSLGLSHLVIASGFMAMAVARPPRWVRAAVVGLAVVAAVGLPAIWVGPLWRDGQAVPGFARDFYLGFVLSLLIPLIFGGGTALRFAAMTPAPRVARRVAWPLLAYLAGLVVSYPVGFNYALFYLFLR